jgi:DNA-binding NarL/FixJ family response regulator
MTHTVRVPLREFRPRRPLTPAQARLLPLLAEGLDYGEMAAEVHCSPHTVRVHVVAIADKLPGCSDPYLRAVRYAIIVAMERLHAEDAAPGAAA